MNKLEHMSPEVLAQFKAEVFARLAESQQTDGIPEVWNFQYIPGTKPAGNSKAT